MTCLRVDPFVAKFSNFHSRRPSASLAVKAVPLPCRLGNENTPRGSQLEVVRRVVTDHRYAQAIRPAKYIHGP